MDDEAKNQETNTEPEADKPVAKPDKPAKKIPIGGNHWQRFRGWYVSNKKWTIVASVLLFLIILFAIPWTRYKVAGLVLKKAFTIEIVDAASHSPVSGATVSSGSRSAQTDGNGKAKLRMSDGHHAVVISKKYYKERRADVLVPILRQKNTAKINLTATGRQVKIVIKNLVSQKTLGEVNIKVADITAKTDKDGIAVIVLPAGMATQKALLSLNGYNNSDVDVKVSDTIVAENDFTLTPAGKVYFLSKRTGKLDLMKANLDGSGAQVVVAGTGSEQNYDTSLLPSPDWKYIALVAKRSPTDPTPQLYVLSTADDKMLSADSGNASFTLKGWAGDKLIYYVTRNDLQAWQMGKDKLKSYDASSGKITLLDQNSATGDANTSAYEYYAIVTVSGNNVVFAKNWTQVYYSSPPGLLGDKQNTLSLINADGQGHKIIASYDASNSVQYTQHGPNSIYIWQQVQPQTDKFFEYTVGLSGPKSVNIDNDDFYRAYPSYYLSPSGKQAFWAESRDGKNTLFVGDGIGLNGSTIATLSEYDPYGWFTNDYLVVTKDNSQLYVMGLKGGKATKITDYQPTSQYQGY